MALLAATIFSDCTVHSNRKAIETLEPFQKAVQETAGTCAWHIV